MSVVKYQRVNDTAIDEKKKESSDQYKHKHNTDVLFIWHFGQSINNAIITAKLGKKILNWHTNRASTAQSKPQQVTWGADLKAISRYG